MTELQTLRDERDQLAAQLAVCQQAIEPLLKDLAMLLSDIRLPQNKQGLAAIYAEYDFFGEMARKYKVANAAIINLPARAAALLAVVQKVRPLTNFAWSALTADCDEARG